MRADLCSYVGGRRLHVAEQLEMSLYICYPILLWQSLINYLRCENKLK
jgi:hypothetical protein